jgi:hypothetical protein
MVKVSTLFHRVDGFDETNRTLDAPLEIQDLKIDDDYLNNLLQPLLYDPGERLVQDLLQKI